jgi:cytoskeletal protein CcmA (bactofilin family)
MFAGASISDARNKIEAIPLRTAITLRKIADAAIIRLAGKGRYRNRQASFVTTPPLRAFRTTPRDPRSAELPASLLGRALTAKRFLDTEGDLHIHGKVFGRVCADHLVLGSGGYLNGDVVARDVYIGGRLTGRIFAFHVTLDSSADVTARIFLHEVMVAKGARVDARMPRRPPSYFDSLKQPRSPNHEHVHAQ